MIARELGPGYAVRAVTAPGGGDPLRFDVSLALRDGTPLTLELIPPDTGLSGWVLAALAFQLAVLAVFTALAVRVATQPLAQLADAADKLGPDLRAPRLPENGPREVARASTAFNAMQQRIAEHLAERTGILAAISHDLQSPITRMRLRTDLLDDAPLKRKLQGDLAAMQTLIEQGIDLARSAGSRTEPFVATDVQALLESLVYDYADSGQHVDLTGRIDHPVMTAPQALRRILTNLVDNALKFGGERGHRDRSPCGGPHRDRGTRPRSRHPGGTARLRAGAVLSAGRIAQPQDRRRRPWPCDRKRACKSARRRACAE